MKYLTTLREADASAATRNYHLAALKQFCRWMVAERRATESPVAHLKGLNVRTDRRYVRRALEPDELRRLLQAAHDGPDRLGMTGPARALLYWLAAETGIRRAELVSLTPRSFDLGDAPTVTVAAAYSKRRRDDVLPLRRDLADALSEYLTAGQDSDQAFAIPAKTAQLLAADLAAAGISVRDDGGRVLDFHGLRHTFITGLARAGVHPKTAQSLARHSTITLTMDRYTHTLQSDERDALDALPDVGLVRASTSATGTDGGSCLRKSCPSGSEHGVSVRSGAQETDLALSGKATGRTRTDNLRFTKPLLCH